MREMERQTDRQTDREERERVFILKKIYENLEKESKEQEARPSTLGEIRGNFYGSCR